MEAQARGEAGNADAWRLPETLQCVAVTCLAGAICVLPRVVPWILGVVTLLYLWPVYLRQGARQLPHYLRQSLAGIAPVATLLLPVLGVASTVWSSHRRDSFDTAGMAVMIAVSTLFLLPRVDEQMRGLSPLWRRRFVRAVACGGIAGLAFLVIETLTGNGMTRRALTLIPGLSGARGKGITFDAGQVSDVAGFFMNRNIAGVTLLAIPMALAVGLWLDGTVRKVTLAAVAVALVLVIFGSQSETAKLALVTGCLTVLAAHRWPRATMGTLAGGLTLVLVFTVTLARAPHAFKLHEATWLPYSHRDRVQIWDYNAELTSRHPWLGAGVEAGKGLQAEFGKGSKPGAAQDVRRRPAWHAHNFYLQTRLELGFVGSLAALVFGLAMIAAASRMPPRLMPWALGMIAATMTSAISGWGLWQYWFLAGLGADVVFLALIDAEQRLRADTKA
jgi:O-antigen ligase